jgi:hypothetical protein
MRERIKEEAPPGARLVWDEAAGRLVLRVPKSESPPAPRAKPPQSASFAIIDRVLAAASKAAKEA